MSERDHLALLLKVNTILNSHQSLDDVLKDLISNVIETLKAERGFVVLREDGGWQSAAAHHMKGSNTETIFSRTVVNRVAETGQGLVTLDAQADPSMRSRSVQTQGLISIVCAPLRWDGEVRGVVYADSRLNRGIFKKPELQILEAIADQASRALETAALHELLQRIHRQSLDKVSETEQVEEQAGLAALDGVLEVMESSHPQSTAAPQAQLTGPLQIRLFGELEVVAKGQPVTSWKARKDRQVFTYLALHPGRIVHEDVLIELFWSRGGKKARHSLHNSITQIRKSIGDSQRTLLQRQLDGYTLSEECRIDAQEFEQAFQTGRLAAAEGRWEEAMLSLRQAEKWAENDLLSEWRQEWVLPSRFRCSQQLIDCQSLMAQYFSERGKHLVAVELWKRVLEHDNCNEDAYRGLLEAHRALGRRAEMAKVLQACAKAYKEELDLPPPPEFEQLLNF